MIKLAVIATLLDLATFLPMVAIFGLAAEGNPIVARLASIALPLALAPKLVIAGVIANSRRLFHRYTPLVVLIAIAVGTIGTLTNIHSLMFSS
jgi:hypothetical protein